MHGIVVKLIPKQLGQGKCPRLSQSLASHPPTHITTDQLQLWLYHVYESNSHVYESNSHIQKEACMELQSNSDASILKQLGPPGYAQTTHNHWCAKPQNNNPHRTGHRSTSDGLHGYKRIRQGLPVFTLLVYTAPEKHIIYTAPEEHIIYTAPE